MIQTKIKLELALMLLILKITVYQMILLLNAEIRIRYLLGNELAVEKLFNRLSFATTHSQMAYENNLKWKHYYFDFCPFIFQIYLITNFHAC